MIFSYLSVLLSFFVYWRLQVGDLCVFFHRCFGGGTLTVAISLDASVDPASQKGIEAQQCILPRAGFTGICSCLKLSNRAVFGRK